MMNKFPSSLLIFGLLLGLLPQAFAQENTNQNKFRQLYDVLPTPNVYRNAAGAPGHKYWQQRADYDMDIRLDNENQRIYGTETITYHNESPDALEYLWLQLDQNRRAKTSQTYEVSTSTISDQMSTWALKSIEAPDFDGGFKIEFVKDKDGNPLPHTINYTMMRVDMPKPLQPGDEYTFQVKWWYNINDRSKLGGRSGFEYFEEENNYLYTIAQFYPRMCLYNDVEGWQNKQFLGRGEFTLTFGNFKVKLTVPADHVVASTGTLQNAKEILTATQRKRMEQAKSATENPVMIVTPEEALEAEQAEKSDREKTWIYEAENVRDFAFASSRKFIWDAMAVKFGDRTVLAMSYYPKEGNPLWERYSTRIVAHTLEVYSRHTFDYPYPVAISVHTDRIGMEYPMICFNGGRPEADGTYSERTKYGMLGVIIHEVGHNYFPMIINSDERQWTWMDEGLNTFLQYLTEQEWERGYPSRRGPAYKIVPYMKGDKSTISPIMTNSESIFQFGNNAYGKPATAMNILRETIMGRELFDHAFKTYAQRWMFRHPSPADLFRTMEDASGVDLDWFWRGWFFTNDHVDIELADVTWYQMSTENPEVEKPIASKKAEQTREFIGDTRNRTSIASTVTERDTNMLDFYNRYNPYEVTVFDKQAYQRYLSNFSEEERKKLGDTRHYYQLDFKNKGGLVMPLILEFEFEDGTTEVKRIPAEIWRLTPDEVSKVFVFEKPLKSIQLDPFRETADVDTGNNHWPPQAQPSRFKLYKRNYSQPNPMQLEKRAKELEDQTGAIDED
ncbi:MAG: M1 family metallopeptidase [Bacteroidota bacterium]